jgi:hypothetical protein
MSTESLRLKSGKFHEILSSRDQLVLEIAGADESDLNRLFNGLNIEYSLDLSDDDIEFLSNNPNFILDNFELSDEQINLVSGGKGGSDQKNRTISASSLNGKTTHLASHFHYTIDGDLNGATIISPDSSFTVHGNSSNSHITTN